MDNDQHEQLPELSDRASTQPDAPPPESKSANVSQWRLLKLILESGSKGLALADICSMFDVSDRQSEVVQQGINQLLKAGRIAPSFGISTKGHLGNVYTATDIGRSTFADRRSKN